MPFIKIDNISYTYPVVTEMDDSGEPVVRDTRPALSGASLNIEKGQFVCILGRNGSGKSTLARHLNALLIPDEGKVIINGLDTSDENNIFDIRKTVGMVFQNPDNQIIGSVVEEDVAFGLENTGVPSEEIQRRVAEVLERVGLYEYAKGSPNHLSGGQKQRVAVAGVLAMRPECIVLDEATSMLDPQGRKEIMQMASELNKEKGITVIAITHYMDEALLADKVFVMSEGKIVMEGTPEEIFSRKEEIEALGLKLPPSCILADKLRKKGLNIPTYVITADQLTKVLKGMMS